METSGKSSKTLAAVVVAYRVLGCNKQDAIQAMQELERRKADGDEFDYVSFIDEQVKNKPTPRFSNKESMSLLNLLRNIKVTK